jgi:ribosomal protein L23
MNLYNFKLKLIFNKFKTLKFIKCFLNTKKLQLIDNRNTLLLIVNKYITKKDIKNFFNFFFPNIKIKHVNTCILKKKNNKYKKIYLTI